MIGQQLYRGFFSFFHLYYFYRYLGGVNMKDTDSKEMREWILNNLVTKQGAMKITGQSGPAFQQAVRTNMVTPFVEYNESPVVRLYLKSEIEAYAKQVALRKNKLKK